MSELQEAGPSDLGRRWMVASAGLFAGIAALIGVDVVGDYRAGANPVHLVVELAVMVFALAGVAGLLLRLRAAHHAAARLGVDLEAARAEARHFREDAHALLRGLGEAIDQQFGRWNLTLAEREVALLLLKGLSHREIASARATAESTVRQQALAVYRKASLRGRSDLAAFFLEDLLLPPPPSSDADAAATRLTTGTRSASERPD